MWLSQQNKTKLYLLYIQNNLLIFHIYIIKLLISELHGRDKSLGVWKSKNKKVHQDFFHDPIFKSEIIVQKVRMILLWGFPVW